jgi:hypothetical protein
MNIQYGIVDIISPHVTALMQVLTNDFPQYNMRLITTKCLNTGIMIVFSLLGQKGFELVDQCDSNKTTERHKAGKEDNTNIFKELRKQLLSRQEKQSKLYYMLLSDGYFPYNTETKYFPGHVIIFEKHYHAIDKTHYFRVHQSYINKYNLKQYNNIVNKKLSVANIEKVLIGLESIMNSHTWTKSNIQLWTKLTNVDTTDLSNTQSKNKFFLCFRTATIDNCVFSLKNYIKDKLDKLRDVASKAPNDIYGNISLYLDKSIALTNRNIQKELIMLLYKLQQNERICNKHNNGKFYNSNTN